MKFFDLVSTTHTDKMVIFYGYNGDDEEPVAVVETAEDRKKVRVLYDDLEVAVIEAVDSSLFVWLADDESRLRDLANKLIQNLRDYECNDHEVANIIRSYGFTKAELKRLRVGDLSLYDVMDKHTW